MLKTGAAIAGYRIEGVLGTGGMGVVYEATQLSLQRTVALKVVAPHLGADERFRERFRREAMLQAALEHPNIVTVYETGESDEGLYLAMRLVRGTNLKQLVLEGDLEPGRALEILAQVGSALDAAHEAGLIHRDVKPQNVLVDEDDHAYLADFGLIKSSTHRGVTATGQYLGSLSYVSPEQIRGEPVSALSDVYAFAAMVHECLALDVPFAADSEAALLYAHLSEPPPRVSEARPELPEALDAVVARGLAKRPEERYRTASALVDEARAALTGGSGASAPGIAAATARRTNGRAPAVRGERDRFGDTIVDAGPLRVPPEIGLEPERRLSRTAIVLLAVVVAALAAAGFLLGNSRDKVADPATQLAFGGQLSLVFPQDEWRRAERSEPVEGLALEGPIALESSEAESPGELRAGMLPSAEGPRLLPQALVARLTKPPRGEPVRLGSLAALRYRGLRPRGSRAPFTVFVVPTDRGAAALACLGGRSVPETTIERPFERRCEEVATSLRLGDLHARPLGLDPRYVAAVGRALARLDARRTRLRRLLAAAATPGTQARDAARLQAAYGVAGRALRKEKPGVVERPLHRALDAALGEARSAYRKLAAAARTGRRVAYRRSVITVRRAEAQVARAARSFQP